MKKLKSYSNIWKVEKIMYSFNDFELPFPVTFNQLAWFVVSFLFMLNFGGFIPDKGIRYVGVPIGVTLFMSKLTFDGKKPYRYLCSLFQYAIRAKVTYAGKRVVYGKQRLDEKITAVRSVMYVPD